ncbi:MAG TPA: phage tail sheath subtilisin-like domain-containing protein [Elusimicrobiales bacterium]|nr:phage tail sheath subtilisin-like domain-containing protein [Elusimicrobiales bacterium]
MTIQFETIPGGIRTPGKYLEYNNKLAVRTLPANEQKLLIVGQKTSAGPAAALTPVQVVSDQQAAELFGPGSIAHLMVAAAVAANPYLDLTVVPQADAAESSKAGGSFAVAGPATGAGTLRIGIGSKLLEIAVAANDSATAIAAAIAAAIPAGSSLPVTATADSGTVTITAKNAGTLGNLITLSCEKIGAAGVTVTVTQPTGGATDPDISLALATVTAKQFHKIVSPLSAQTPLTALRTHLASVSDYRNQKPGIGVYGYNAVLADAVTLAGQLNGERLVCAYLRGSKSLPCEIAASMAAVMASETDPARPLNSLELKGLDVPALSSRFSGTEVENLLHNGITPLEVGPGEKVQIVRAITTYTVNAAGAADVSYLDVTTITTLDYLREACRTRMALRFPREKLFTRKLEDIRLELYDVLKKCEELEIVEAVDENKDALIVERSETSVNQVNAAIPADVVNGLHVFAGRIDLLL